MNTEQAYINGFVKRANEHGCSRQDIMELVKSSAFQQNIRNFLQKYPKAPIARVADIADTRNSMAQMIRKMRSPEGINNILRDTLNRSIPDGTALGATTMKLRQPMELLDKYTALASGNQAHPIGTTLSSHEGLSPTPWQLQNSVNQNIKNKIMRKLDSWHGLQ